MVASILGLGRPEQLLHDSLHPSDLSQLRFDQLPEPHEPSTEPAWFLKPHLHSLLEGEEGDSKCPAKGYTCPFKGIAGERESTNEDFKESNMP